jgi:hypothetical protein
MSFVLAGLSFSSRSMGTFCTDHNTANAVPDRNSRRMCECLLISNLFGYDISNADSWESNEWVVVNNELERV